MASDPHRSRTMSYPDSKMPSFGQTNGMNHGPHENRVLGSPPMHASTQPLPLRSLFERIHNASRNVRELECVALVLISELEGVNNRFYGNANMNGGQPDPAPPEPMLHEGMPVLATGEMLVQELEHRINRIAELLPEIAAQTNRLHDTID